MVKNGRKVKTRGAGTIVRVERAKRGLTQVDLAVLAGVSLGTVNLAERSGRISEKVAKKFAAALGIPAAEIMTVATNETRRPRMVA